MKRVMLIFLLTAFLYNYSFSQYSAINKKLIPETIEIMNYLHVRVRDSLKQDGVLQIQLLDTNNPKYKDAAASFARSKSGRTLDSNGDAVKYSNPVIYVTASIDSLINNKGHQSRFKEFYGKAILIHELTHFLQKTVCITYGSRTKEDDPTFISTYRMKMRLWRFLAIIFLNIILQIF